MSEWEPVDLGDPQLNREINTLTAMMDDSPSSWWWLSFTDSELPKGSQFLGVAIVSAPNMAMAAMESHRLGCNPGGGISMVEIPDEYVPALELRERLLSRADLEAADLV